MSSRPTSDREINGDYRPRDYREIQARSVSHADRAMLSAFVCAISCERRDERFSTIFNTDKGGGATRAQGRLAPTGNHCGVGTTSANSKLFSFYTPAAARAQAAAASAGSPGHRGAHFASQDSASLVLQVYFKGPVNLGSDVQSAFDKIC